MKGSKRERRRREPIGITTPEQLEAHRELEYLRAAGAVYGFAKRHGPRRSAVAWLETRRRKLDGAQRAAAARTRMLPARG